MSRLTVLKGLPAAAYSKIAAHRYRLVGGKVLLTNDSGAYVFLSESEYAEYLKGLDPSHPLAADLARRGFLPGEGSEESLAVAELEKSLFVWNGPGRHRIMLDDKNVMSVGTARAVVDFIFSVPGRGVAIDFSAPSEFSWPAAWFIVEYAIRRSEWARRPLSLGVVIPQGHAVEPEQRDFFAAHGVSLCAAVEARGVPPAREAPKADRAIVLVAGASNARQWVDRWVSSGIGMVRLKPSPNMMTVAGIFDFLEFYRAALIRMLETGGIREERAVGFLTGKKWHIPGQDILNELSYDPEGRIYPSAQGRAQGTEGPWVLGKAGLTRLPELAAKESVRAVIAASLGENQPLCFQCVYKPYCSLPPAASHRRQGTLWGQTPSSLACTLHMGILDAIFEILGRDEHAAALSGWGTSQEP